MVVTSSVNVQGRLAAIRVIEEDIADLAAIPEEPYGVQGTVRAHISRLEAERGWLLEHVTTGKGAS